MVKHKLYEVLLDPRYLPKELQDHQSREEFMQFLDSQLSIIHLEKNQLLLTPGNIADQIYFLDQGAAKGYFKDEYKQPHVLYIWDEKSFITDNLSYFLDVPTDLYIEITQESVVLSISKEKLKETMKVFPYLHEIVDAIFYNDFMQCRKRIMDLISLTSADRYHKLKEYMTDSKESAANSSILFLFVFTQGRYPSGVCNYQQKQKRLMSPPAAYII